MFLLAFLVFVIVSGLLVYFVLLQEPKQGGLSSSMGGSSDFLGGRGVSGGLIRITVTLGALFVLFAVLLNRIPR